jgi:hypothetical protein
MRVSKLMIQALCVILMGLALPGATLQTNGRLGSGCDAGTVCSGSAEIRL